MAVLTDLKWQALATLVRTAGRASEGIDLGFQAGFDSGAMLDYVYENRARGRWLIGRLIDRIYLDAIGWRAIRARKRLLQRVLGFEIARVQTETRPAVILDVASGPGRYLIELCARGPANPVFSGADVQVICRDLDPRGLDIGAARAAALGLTNVRFEMGDALDPASLATISPRPHIAVVSGLYELFRDTGPIERSLRAIRSILPPGGRLIFTTQIRHPQLELIAKVLVNRDGQPWEMVCRELNEIEALARTAGFAVVSSEVEHHGLFAVTVCRTEPRWTDGRQA